MAIAKWFVSTVLGWFTGDTLGRVLDTVDARVNNETERERIRTTAITEYAKQQVTYLSGKAWWFPLFFLIPTGAWYAAVCIYSILFCKACAFPQDWTIAALPPPLDEWAGVIITSLFIGKFGEQIFARWGRK